MNTRTELDPIFSVSSYNEFQSSLQEVGRSVQTIKIGHPIFQFICIEVYRYTRGNRYVDYMPINTP